MKDSITHTWRCRGRSARDTLCHSACGPIQPPRHVLGHSTVCHQ